MDNTTNVLSGKELLDLRTAKVVHPRSLPSMPPKEFVPTGSTEEAESIVFMVREKVSFLKDERVEKKNLLSHAEWLPEEGVARVTQRVGCWETYGHEENGGFFLNPEEALFLLELSKLELSYGGIPVSIQQAYQLLLKEEHCSVDEYKVYAHMNRQGYRLLRHKPPDSEEETSRPGSSQQGPPPKRAKMMEDPEEASDLLSKPLFMPLAADPSDFDLIPHFAPGAEAILIRFPDPSLLPEAIRANREASYTIRRDSFASNSPDDPSELPTTFEEVDRSNDPLYQGETKPLLDGYCRGDIYAQLKRIFSSSVQESESSSDEEDDDDESLQISFDVYSPSRKFKKTQPGPPCYCLAVTNWASPFPSYASTERFKRRCGAQSVPLVAVVGQGGDVAFYQLKDIVSPFSD